MLAAAAAAEQRRQRLLLNFDSRLWLPRNRKCRDDKKGTASVRTTPLFVDLAPSRPPVAENLTAVLLASRSECHHESKWRKK